jgi:DNA-damage-inducible protein J
MTKAEMIRARVDRDLKREAGELFSELGLSATEAITLFYRQVTLHQGMPFDVRMPNAETVKVLREARDGVGLTEYGGLDSLKAEFD